MRVITVLSETDARNLLKSKELESNQTIEFFNKNFLNVVHGYSSDNTGYNNMPMVGISTIDDETVNLEKHFDYVSNYLPTVAGDFIIEVDVPKDELLFMRWSEFLELDEEGELVESDDSLYAEDIIDNLFLEKPEQDSEELLCFFPILRLNQCRRFLVVADNWDSEEKEFGNVPRVNVNRLGVFD